MATFKRVKWYWMDMDDVVNGVRYRLPLKTKNWQEALRKEKETLAAIAEGKVGSQAAGARKPGDLSTIPEPLQTQEPLPPC